MFLWVDSYTFRSNSSQHCVINVYNNKKMKYNLTHGYYLENNKVKNILSLNKNYCWKSRSIAVHVVPNFMLE